MARLIVVGLDGSENAEHALRYAIGEATAHQSDLRLVTAWQGPVFWLDPYSIEADYGQIGVEARRRLEQLADEVAQELGRPVQRVAECGAAPQVLVDQAESADLLVIGARGRGGFAGVLLGSVANQVAHHTPCPLVIVPCPDPSGSR